MSAEAEVATSVASDAIAEVIGSDDPLDSPDFDPIEYINAQFPSETSLEKLDPFVGRLQAQIASLDDEISEAVQAQSEAGEKAERDILEAQTAILELHSKIDGIKSKAEESERMVLEICRDIQSLDHAKRNLQTTITALKRLHMLLTAVEQLSATAGEKQYREAANLLDAVRQLLTHFEPYAAIPKIAELQATVAAVSTTLEREIFDAFVAIGHLADSVADASIVSDGAGGSLGSLSDACLVVDALGAHARRKQVEAFCAQQLAPYAKLFPRGQDVASLDQVERRFVWFRRLQGTLDDKFGHVFPQHWRVQHRVCLLFLDQTRAMLLEVLGAGGPETEKAEVLLKALTKTRMFETEMKEAYEDDDGAKGDLREEVGFDEEGNVVELSAAEKIRRKYAAQRAAQDKPKDAAPKSRFAGLAAEGSDAQQALEEAAAMEDALQPIAGRLSSVYDPFLGPYITLEKKRMEEMLESAAEEKAINEDDMSLPVFTSSVSLFAYVKTAVKRCTPLTTGQTFFNLHKAFKECLENYGRRAHAAFARARAPFRRLSRRRLARLPANRAPSLSQASAGQVPATAARAERAGLRGRVPPARGEREGRVLRHQHGRVLRRNHTAAAGYHPQQDRQGVRRLDRSERRAGQFPGRGRDGDPRARARPAGSARARAPHARADELGHVRGRRRGVGVRAVHERLRAAVHPRGAWRAQTPGARNARLESSPSAAAPRRCASYSRRSTFGCSARSLRASSCQASTRLCARPNASTRWARTSCCSTCTTSRFAQLPLSAAPGYSKASARRPRSGADAAAADRWPRRVRSGSAKRGAAALHEIRDQTHGARRNGASPNLLLCGSARPRLTTTGADHRCSS